MPVIVVGADTPLGQVVLDALLPRDSEVRAFITDRSCLDALRARGVKVAVGDVSDGSHVGTASIGAFCAVLLSAAAEDQRERSFAIDRRSVIEAWADGLRDYPVARIVIVSSTDSDATAFRSLDAQLAVVASDAPPHVVAAEVSRIESLKHLDTS